MPCCRCNRSGRCRNCSCVKAGSTCQSCLPQRQGNCSNNGSTTTPPQKLFQIPEHHTTMSIAAPDEGSPMNTTDESEHEGTPPTMPVSPPITTLVSPPAQQPRNFRWGPHEGDEFYSIISNVYEEVIHWRRNVFLVPSGSTGKAFVSELARLFQA